VSASDEREATVTVEDPSPATVGLDDPAFPVDFDDPSDAELAWEWDDMHMPFAVAPLAGDFVRVVGSGFDDPNIRYSDVGFGTFPQRWHCAVWNGYSYFAIRRNYSPEERPAVIERYTAMARSRIEVTDAYWREELLPELHRAYDRIESVPVETGSGHEVAAAWESAWQAAERAWAIHFDAILGPYQVMDDLADAYEVANPGAPPGEALRLAQGGHHELLDVELGAEQLAALAAASPGVSDALRAGVRSIEALGELPGGREFIAALEAFLGRHGHLGQSVDDLSLESWGEEPGNLLTELAKRLEHTPEPAEERRARLEREAGELADAARARLADRPDDLAKFEHALRYARSIGFLTEVHNYWIDRKSQARIRSLAMRVGHRLVSEGVIDQANDVLYLHRGEIAELLRTPRNRRPIIDARRSEHARQQRITPPRYVGRPPPAPIAVDRFDGTRIDSTEADVLRGTGASSGVVRGPARVVLTSREFDRIMPGDIIVCPSSNPSWVPVFTIAGGLVTNTGGVLSHAAVVAREFGLPAVVGVANATTTIRDGQLLEIDGVAGTVRLL
jgi:phosphohistidine swiveling domain-containing protein